MSISMESVTLRLRAGGSEEGGLRDVVAYVLREAALECLDVALLAEGKAAHTAIDCARVLRERAHRFEYPQGTKKC